MCAPPHVAGRRAKPIAGVAEATGGAGTQEMARRGDATLARLLAPPAAG